MAKEHYGGTSSSLSYDVMTCGYNTVGLGASMVVNSIRRGDLHRDSFLRPVPTAVLPDLGPDTFDYTFELDAVEPGG